MNLRWWQQAVGVHAEHGDIAAASVLTCTLTDGAGNATSGQI